MKAFEVISLITYPDLNRKFLKTYIVIAESTPKAVMKLKLREHEEVVEAREMNHEVVL